MRSIGRLGWGSGGTLVPADLPALLPQWLPAGCWEPLSLNVYTTLFPLQFVGAGNLSIPTIRFDFDSTDEWFFVTKPPENWTSGKIKFIPEFICVPALGTPQTIVFELGVEYISDGFLLDATTAFQTVLSSKVPILSTVPQYVIGTTSAELTITGSPDSSGSLLLRIKRATGFESDEKNLVGIKLLYV